MIDQYPEIAEFHGHSHTAHNHNQQIRNIYPAVEEFGIADPGSKTVIDKICKYGYQNHNQRQIPANVFHCFLQYKPNVFLLLHLR